MIYSSKFLMVCSIALVWPSIVERVSAQPDVFAETCLQAFPDTMQARIELRDRHLAQLLPHGVADGSPEYVMTIIKRWLPGQTITVAFNGGTYALRKDIADTASEWTRHAHLTFDFGHAPDAQTFREWSEADTSYAADIRISVHFRGYWSLVGTDSNNPAIVNPHEPSMNFGGFHLIRPADWKGTVLHEFGHALGFQHEHQHPLGGCDSEFRWYDDPGYIPTTDSTGQFIPDTAGRRPGIYTVLAGKPNEWPRWKVDHNLRQLPPTPAYDVGTFDPNSIMKYYFPEWMFHDMSSHCFTPTRNTSLSEGDMAGVKRAYPLAPTAVLDAVMERERVLSEILASPRFPDRQRPVFEAIFQSLQELKK